MVVTRAQKEMKAVTHVLRNVLGEEEGSDLEKMFKFEKIKALDVLTDMPDSSLNRLEFMAADKVAVVLGKGEVTELYMLKKYLLTDEWKEAKAEDFMNMTKEDYDAFRRERRLNKPKKPTSPLVTNSNSSAESDYILTGIVRDPRLFPILKDERMQEEWHMDMMIQAKVQGIREVTDASYTPDTDHAMKIFNAKQNYFFGVLRKVVMTDRGKQIVKGYYKSGSKEISDARAAYIALETYHKDSTKAEKIWNTPT